MSLRESSGNSIKGHLPTQVSSASSLDSFLINLPTTAESSNYMNIDDYGNNATQSEYEANGTSSNSLDDFDETDQMTRGFGFESDDVEAQASEMLRAQAEQPVARPIQGRRVSAPPAISSSAVVNSSVPEFLYQLTKMLTDDNNDVIEWSSGRIEVHSPQKLESHVLKKYFRHSKFASFQRQLNYFGFRKLAGKGKMAPCSYVNDTAMEDINSLFHIKRKSGGDQHDNQNKKRRDSGMKVARRDTIPQVNPVLAGIYNRTSQKPIAPSTLSRPAIPPVMNPLESQVLSTGSAPMSAHQELARQAVGKGIRHEFGRPPAVPAPAPVPSAKLPPTAVPVASLNELTSNYHNSLMNNHENVFDNDDEPTPLSQMQGRSGPFDTYTGGFLSRNSSLIDLAMIAPVEDTSSSELAPSSLAPAVDASRGFGFIDFFSTDGHVSETQPGGSSS